MLLNLVKIFAPTTVAFFLGVFITPLATHFFFKHKMWKKYSRNGEISSPDFHKIHNEQEELNTPRVGGIIIWFSALMSTLLFYLAAVIFPGVVTEKMNFLSRNQTLIPFFTLLFGSLLGLSDDLIQIYGNGKFGWQMILTMRAKRLINFFMAKNKRFLLDTQIFIWCFLKT